MSGADPRPLFEVLEPPPGGLTRLRARIGRERRRRVRRWSLAMAAAALALAALTAPLLPRGDAGPWAPGAPDVDALALQVGLGEPPAETVSIRPDLRRRYAVREVPTTDERVVFFMVGSR